MKRKAQISFPLEAIKIEHPGGDSLKVVGIHYEPLREMLHLIVETAYDSAPFITEVPPGQELPILTMLFEGDSEWTLEIDKEFF